MPDASWQKLRIDYTGGLRDAYRGTKNQLSATTIHPQQHFLRARPSAGIGDPRLPFRQAGYKG
jgi:hypothetical protein